jgi:hypothetical protein
VKINKRMSPKTPNARPATYVFGHPAKVEPLLLPPSPSAAAVTVAITVDVTDNLDVGDIVPVGNAAAADPDWVGDPVGDLVEELVEDPF